MSGEPVHAREYELKRYDDATCQDHDMRIALIEQALFGLKTTSEGIIGKLDLLIAQTTKVALLEERHVAQAGDVNRAHERIKALDFVVTSHIKEAEAFINHSKGRDKVLWAMGAAIFALLIKSLFFAAHITP